MGNDHNAQRAVSTGMSALALGAVVLSACVGGDARAGDTRSGSARRPVPVEPIVIDAPRDGDPGGAPTPARATHYCDCAQGAASGCMPGSDSAGDGSADKPFRTTEKARQTLLSGACGDAVYLCRGGAFDVWKEGVWTVAGEFCAPGNYRKLGAYDAKWGAGGKRPLVSGRTTFFNHVKTRKPGGGVEVEGLELRCVGCAGKKKYRGFRFYGAQRNWLIEDVVIDGFGFAIQLGSDGKQPNASDIVVAGSTILNSTGMGILGAADRMIVHHTVFRNNACAGYGPNEASQCAYDHAWYIDGGENLETGHSRFRDVVLRDSVFQDNCNLGSSGRCACAVVVNRGQSNLRIEGNTFVSNLDYGPECIAIDGTGTSSNRRESCIDCTIRDNTFLGGWSRVINLGGSPGLVVEGNRMQVLQGPTDPVHCAGINVKPKKDGKAGGGEERVSSGVTIRGNAIYFDADMGGDEECIGIAIADEAAGHIVTDNAIYMEGAGELDCFHIGGEPAKVMQAMDRNVCGRGGPGTSFDWNKTGEGLEQWRSVAPKLDVGSRQANPGFVHPRASYPAKEFRSSVGRK